MGQELINVRIEIERETDLAVDRWARSEGRSKRRHVAVLVRKLASLAKSQPEDLRRLGLMDGGMVAAGGR